MLHNKLIHFLWIFWCCALCENVVTREIVSKNVLVKTYFNNGTVYVEGHSVQSSYIKFLTGNRTFSKLYVYVADTFYADEDLELHGIEELQIFAHTWMVDRDRTVTFDLSGWNGTNHEPTIFKGAAGNSGNSGLNGGNFLGLANKLINIKHLTIISNGGNGGDGQDGTASDDTYALFSGDDGIGESGWFSQVDFHKYYEKYFDDKGYDVEISDIDDSTSLYAVFVHNKKASFNIRLHPRKCCGTTGIGGAGGTGGRNGMLIFNYVGGFYDAYIKTPNFAGINGTAGNSGRDAKTCETFALDVRADTELKKIVFFYPPLHQSFTNHFTVLNHINSSKCLPEYVKNEQSISKPTEIKIDTSVNRYKKFLLENMKNKSLTTNIFETYKAIDENWKINGEYSFDALILEWYEIEKHCSELKKSINGKFLYSRLFTKINYIKSLNDEDEEISYCLESLLSYKFINLLEHEDVIMNLKLYVGYALREIEIRNNQLPELNVSDEALVNHYYQLMLGIKGNDALAIYNHAIEGFKLAYFPFAAEYLKMYEMSASFWDYVDLNAISLLVSQKLNTLNSNIDTINSNGDGSVISRKDIDKTDPESTFFIWKNSDIRDEIQDLFAGKKITLLADIKQATTHYNALRFNTIDLVFRSANQTVADGLNDALKLFEVALNHTGQSAFRCNNNFYEITSDSVYITSSFIKDESQVPEYHNDMYDKLRDNRALLSPYALWELQISAIHLSRQKLNKLKQYAKSVDFQFDMELHGTGEFIREDEPMCEHADLAKFYSQIKN